MAQTLTQEVMKRTHLDKQRRFVQLYLHLAKDFRELRTRPDIKKRIENICTETLYEVVPELSDNAFENFDVGKIQPYLANKLSHDPIVRDYAHSNSEISEVFCSLLSRLVVEGYDYIMHRQLTSKLMWQRNISQQK